MRNRSKYLTAIFGGVFMVCGMGSALAATYTVTKTADTNDGACNTDCSLREAVIASNTNAGPDIITLRGGIYLLTLIGANEDNGATGDLDIRGDLTINGAAVSHPNIGRPNIDGNLRDRIFDIIDGVTVNINNVGISNGVLLSGSGAGMYNRGNTTLNNVYFIGNVASGYGGAIQSRTEIPPYLAQLTILNSYFSKNCSDSGGGMDTGGITTIINSRFEGNVPVVKGGVDCKNRDGAAIHFQGGYSNIDKSTFINNVGEVGAINVWGGYLTVTNTTITNNWGTGDAGGIYSEGGGSEITVKNSTIAYNTVAGTRGGAWGDKAGGVSTARVYTYPGDSPEPRLPHIMLINSIIANNTVADGGVGAADCAEDVASYGNNIFGTMAGCGVVLQTSDLVGNPQLAALVTSSIAATDVAQSYLPLLASSPAIDSANNTECTAQDQLSQARPVDGNGDGTAVCDRGAYELVSAKNQITVYARGTPLAGVYPTMVVSVNGMVARTFKVNSTVYTGYTLAANFGAAATHKIDVAFTNDAYVPPEDRNLFVQSLHVGTTIFMPHAAGVTYDRGAGKAAYDGVDVIAGQEVMPWNGALRFTVELALVVNADVCPVGCRYSNIQAALDAAPADATVRVGAGTYYEAVIVSSGKTLWSVSGAFNTTINATGKGKRGVVVSRGVLDGFKVVGGAGGVLVASSGTVRNNLIISNTTVSGEGGGGISVSDYANALIEKNTLTNNRATYGGGIHYGHYSAVTIINNTIEENTATECGGGIHFPSYAAETIRSNKIVGNSARIGGGLCINSYAAPLLTNMLVVNNFAQVRGGGIYAYNYSDAQILNSTITGNRVTLAADVAGISTETYSPMKVSNSIVWGNQGTDISYTWGHNITNSVLGAPYGTGNIVANPLFANAAAGNYRLLATSPAIDTGRSTAINGVTHDIDGVTRPQDGNGLGQGSTGDGSDYDIGAYEFRR